MIDFKKLIVSTIKNDPTIRPLLGVTPDDPRVYSYYQPTAVIDQYKKAYITYANTANPEKTLAVGEPVFSTAIWGLNYEVVEAVRDRLVALLDEQLLTTAEGTVVQPVMLSEHDNYQENTKFSGKTLQWRFGYSRV